MDKKAVAILLKTYWSAGGWKSERSVLVADFEYAKQHKVMFDPVLINHQQTIEWLLSAFAANSKEFVVKCFVSSLSTRRLELRSGLSSYAFARNFPRHDFLYLENFCKICGSYNPGEERQDLNVLNFERIKWGGVRLDDPVYAAFNLQVLAREPVPEPSPADVTILKNIVSTIKSCDASDRPAQLDKKLSSVLKSSSAERRVIIGILGVCGILETNDHKGFFDAYIPFNNRVKRPVNKTDWDYPVDWWTGNDGINEKALNFYFGTYLK